MAINTPDIGASFAGVDEYATRTNAPVSADHLDLMAQSTNFLLCQPDTCVSFAWDARTDDDTSEYATGGAFALYAGPLWVPITPELIVPKRPGHNLLSVRLTATSPADSVIWFQVATSVTPFRPEAQYSVDSNVFRVVGAGLTTYVDASLDTVVCNRESEFETLQLFVMGLPTDTLGDTAEHGSPNTGTVAIMLTDSAMRAASATWDVTSASDSGWAVGHAVQWRNASNVLVEAPRLITAVTSATDLEFFPPVTAPRLSLVGSTYEIIELTPFRLQSLEVDTVQRAT